MKCVNKTFIFCSDRGVGPCQDGGCQQLRHLRWKQVYPGGGQVGKLDRVAIVKTFGQSLAKIISVLKTFKF